MDLKKLRTSDFVGFIGSAVLAGSLFLPWFSTDCDSLSSTGEGEPADCNTNSVLNGDPGQSDAYGSFTAWEVFNILDWLLLAACIAPFVLAWIIARGHELTWRPGEVTMIVGIVAFGLIICNGIILGKPGDSVEIGLDLRLPRGHASARSGSPPREWCARPRAARANRPASDGRQPRGQPARADRGLAPRPQPRDGAGARDRGGRAGGGPLGGAGRQGLPPTRPRWTPCGMMLDTVQMDGVVVIGEGEKDEAPMLYNGEQIGDGSPPKVDIAVDPLEGTELAAEGAPRALAVIALSERGTMFDPGPCVYMEKIAGVATSSRTCSTSTAPSRRRSRLVAKEKGTDVDDVTVVMLKRARHDDVVAQVREAGGRIRFIPHGDVSAALAGGHGARAGGPAVGNRRHARGRDLGGRDQVPRAVRCSGGCGRATRTSARRRSTPATTSTRCST